MDLRREASITSRGVSVQVFLRKYIDIFQGVSGPLPPLPSGPAFDVASII